MIKSFMVSVDGGQATFDGTCPYGTCPYVDGAHPDGGQTA
jgi:hypothetical protein